MTATRFSLRTCSAFSTVLRQVVVRIRPPLAKILPNSGTEQQCIHASSERSVAIVPPESSQCYKNGETGQTFSFSRVFDASTSQEDYFDATAACMVKQLLKNKQHNAVMLAYGTSAAGKTYTIEGTKSEPGVLPRAIDMLFKVQDCFLACILPLQLSSSCMVYGSNTPLLSALQVLAESNEPLKVRVSYYEIYNENIYDLLDNSTAPGQRVQLKLKEDSQGRVYVAGQHPNLPKSPLCCYLLHNAVFNSLECSPNKSIKMCCLMCGAFARPGRD